MKSLRETNIFITELGDQALEQARQSDLRRARQKFLSPLDGIPIAIKDNFSTKNVRTTAGSKMLMEYRPSFDATVVARLCSDQNSQCGSGAVMLGKTTLDEFSMGSFNLNSPFGVPSNPLDLLHLNVDQSLVCGGSSGGSAAAVSAYMSFGCAIG